MSVRLIAHSAVLLTVLLASACSRTPDAGATNGADTQAPAPAAAAAPADTATAAEIKISYLEQQGQMAVGAKYVYKINVENTSKFNLDASGPHAAYVAYHWMSEDGKVVAWDNPKTPIESAIAAGASGATSFSVEAPKSPGSYILKVAMGLADGTDFETSGQTPLHYGVVVE